MPLDDSVFDVVQAIDFDHQALINTIIMRTHDKDGWDLVRLIHQSEVYKNSYATGDPTVILSLDDLKNAEINF